LFLAPPRARRLASTTGLVALAAAGLGACGAPERGAPDDRLPRSGAAGGAIAAGSAVAAVSATDDAGRVARLERPARRVVSHVPGATETLVALGAVDHLVGRTRYDTAAAVRHVASVGGGLDPSVEAVLALRPDLVIAWNADAARGFVERVGAAGVATFVLQTRDTGDVYRMAGRLGALVGRDSAAAALAARVRGDLAAVGGTPVRASRPPTVLFVAWADPVITGGRHMLVSQLIGLAGGRLAFPELTQDSPQLSMEEVVRRQPDVVLVTASPRGGAAERLAESPRWRTLRAVREGRVATLDGGLVLPGPNVARLAGALRDSLQAVLVRHPL
jgi:ABC-type Fe3+-hydroxamate transport system substrate-binding protein